MNGHFSSYQGTLVLASTVAIEVTIEAASIETGNRRRDAHLRSADFFDAENHPLIRFVSENANLQGERLNVEGRLHARGTSVDLRFDATLRCIDDELEIDTNTAVDQRQLGISWSKLGVPGTPSQVLVRGRLVPDRD